MNISYAAPLVTARPTIQVGPIESVLQASPIVQAVLVLLIVLSVISWAIIFTKRRQFALISRANEDFMEYFWKANSLDEIYQKIGKFSESPVAAVFKAGFMELQRIADSAMQKQPQHTSAPGTLKFAGIDNLVRALRKAADIEIAAMENRLNFLATTGSTGPFIGLFGTVWGIMNAFHKIGQTGSASLAVVAPGISEALITTAIGLAAAIPAVVAYNHFISNVKKEELEVSNFTSDFLNLVKRDFFRDE